MNYLLFELITPEGIKVQESVYEVILPTAAGQIAVLPNHEPVVSLAITGVISVRKSSGDADNQLEHYATNGGVIYIQGSRVRFLADSAEHADDIDELRVQEALEKARELQKTAQDHVALADATRLIERNLVRLKVTDLKRRHHQ